MSQTAGNASASAICAQGLVEEKVYVTAIRGAVKLADVPADAGGFTEDVAHAVLARLEAQYPDWFDKFDRVLSCPLSYEREFVLEAMSQAPDGFLRGMLYSALATARQIEQMTGR